MNVRKLLLANISILTFTLTAVAGQDLKNFFTAEEKEQNRRNVRLIADVAAACLDRIYNDHLNFFKRNNVSKYYGDRRYSAKDLEDALITCRAPVSLITQLEPISCVGLTVKCLKEGFVAAKMEDTWNKIYPELRRAGMDGTRLQAMLHELGWKIYYWNPDPAKNEEWDAEDRELNPLDPEKHKDWNPVWGGHAENYRSVQKNNEYYFIPVDDKTTLVGFGTAVPKEFLKIPFFIGTAHSGYHVFPGRNGQVIEAHSMRSLCSIDNLQFSPFNPLATGGGPRWTNSEKYRSGIIVAPNIRE